MTATHLRRLGLIGGISWQSTEVYHRLLNEHVQHRRGGQANAPTIIWSVDFSEVEALQRAGDWPALAALFSAAAQHLQADGAEAIGICANTMHLVADDVAASVEVPLLNMIDVAAAACVARSWSRVGLIGTAYTMASGMFEARLAPRGVEVITPGTEDQGAVHDLIYRELTRGVVEPGSAAILLDVIARLADAGAQAVILGCTEFGLLVRDGDASVPLLDTTALHAAALGDFILEGQPA